MTDENPTFILVKLSNRDARVSCETLSQHDLHHKKESAAVNKHPRGGDRSFEVDQKAHGPSGKSRRGSKGRFSSVKLSSCFPPGSASYIVPNPMMSPARDGLVGDPSGKAWAYAGPVPRSGSVAHLGSVPHAGSNKHRTGPVVGNSCSLRNQCAIAKRISAFRIIPADVVGKKKPPGYESDEPTSPVVTCIGRVRIKPKQCKPWNWPAAVKECGEKKGKRGKKVSFESPADDKHSTGVQGSAKGVSSLQVFGVDDLNCFSSSCEVSNANGALFHPVNESFTSYGAESRLNADCGEANGDLAESKAAVPPPNSLLLMRGSRNSDRLNQEQQSQCSVSVLTRRLSRKVERQCPLMSKRSSEGGIWSRRAVAQPTALDLKKPSKQEPKRDSTA